MKKRSDSIFNSISPSAKSLLMTKAFTSIPFSKEATELVFGKEIEDPKSKEEKLSSLNFILKLIHFETRYWSIDKALSIIGLKNILEFSSGYSFRGLDWCKNQYIRYIDTDLPQLMENKKKVIEKLAEQYCSYNIGNFFMRNLNIFDRKQLVRVLELLPSGPVSIVNEGLLIYLNDEKKRKLCSIIHGILNKRGGYWITADIYVKKDKESSEIVDIFNQQGREFLIEHQVEENKFDSFKSAENFFASCGFNIVQKVEANPSKIGSRKYLARIPSSSLVKLKKRKKTRETWILKCKR